MLLNYINLKKSNNEVLDNETIQLKKVILDYNKESIVNNNLNINGGEIYKGEEYKEDDDIGVDIDKDSTDLASSYCGDVNFICSDICDLENDFDVDTIFQNPPFGSQKNAKNIKRTKISIARNVI